MAAARTRPRVAASLALLAGGGGGSLWPIFVAGLPVTFLHPLVRTTIADRRVRGLSSPYRTDPVIHMEGVWREEDG